MLLDGKNKQSNSYTQGQQSENQYGRQPDDSNTNPVTVNRSYGKQLPATPPFDEDPPQTMYEAVSIYVPVTYKHSSVCLHKLLH